MIVKLMTDKSKNRFQLLGIMMVTTTMISACASSPRLPFMGDRQASANAPSSPSSDIHGAHEDRNEFANPHRNVEGGPVEKKQIAPAAPAFIRTDLLGLSPLQLDQLLGTPALVNNSGGDGQLHRYDNNKCNLIILMRRDASGHMVSDSMRASQKNSSEQRPLLQDCLNGF